VRHPEARKFYETEALRCGWTTRQLDQQINSQLYERIALSRNKAALLRKAETAQLGDEITPEEAIRDPFVLEFLDLKDECSESRLEEALSPPPGWSVGRGAISFCRPGKLQDCSFTTQEK
jgi:predicted nuclease of restriction endonuclease-like (RecB) superfamily